MNQSIWSFHLIISVFIKKFASLNHDNFRNSGGGNGGGNCNGGNNSHSNGGYKSYHTVGLVTSVNRGGY